VRLPGRAKVERTFLAAIKPQQKREHRTTGQNQLYRAVVRQNSALRET
jgi:hypothetical protein